MGLTIPITTCLAKWELRGVFDAVIIDGVNPPAAVRVATTSSNTALHFGPDGEQPKLKLGKSRSFGMNNTE